MPFDLVCFGREFQVDSRWHTMTYTSSDDAWSIVAPWVFRDKRYIVSADVREDVLIVQVEEEFTADRWRGQFEAKRKIQCN